MNYRPFPNERDVSALGFGCMRLPTKKAGDKELIDRDKAIPMLRYAIDNGVNYVDTAYGYHGGDSEVLVGEALRDGYREKVVLATKLPPWHIKKPEDMRRIFDEQRARLGTDVIDVYLLHALNKQCFNELKEMGVFPFLDGLLKEGLIKQAGFSFHDDFEVFKTIADAYPFTVCQIQLNILDTDKQATLEALRYAAERGMSVVVMEPLRGGLLANVPEDVKRIYDAYPVKRSPVDWALRYMLHFPEVITVLSGMGTMEQVKENMAVCSDAAAGCMSEQELKVIAEVKACYEGRTRVPCTGCEYCLPCPQSVAIPSIFGHYNEAAMFDSWEGQRAAYKRHFAESGADRCVECGACEARCPQHIGIIDALKDCVTALEA